MSNVASMIYILVNTTRKGLETRFKCENKYFISTENLPMTMYSVSSQAETQEQFFIEHHYPMSMLIFTVLTSWQGH